MTESWQPVLTGPLANQAIAVVRDIAGALRRHQRAGQNPVVDAGLAVFFSYAADALEEHEWEGWAEEALHTAIEGASQRKMHMGLHGGLTNLGWVLEHVVGSEPGPDDVNLQLDEALISTLRSKDWQGSYDLISGLVGIGMYAQERLHHPSAQRLLTHVLDRLESMAEKSEDGICWFTPPSAIPATQKNIAPNGYYNLGVAHGNPGVIGFLARMHLARVADPRVPEMLAQACQWFCHHDLVGEPGSISNWILKDATSPGEPSRSGWCYGEPGIAIQLWLAGQALDDDALRNRSRAIIRKILNRPEVKAACHDAGLCHGSAGLAHTFNRLGQAMGDDELIAGAAAWFECALSMRSKSSGLGGYLTLHGKPDDESAWKEDPTIITGSAGIGLALLAAATSSSPDWDRFMLMDL